MNDNTTLISVGLKDAIWVGRFQPPTLGHVVSLFVILSRYKNCKIGIVHYSKKPADIPEKWKSYVESAETILKDPLQNPFTPEEVLNMWSAVLNEFNVTDRVELIPMVRVAYQLDFNEKYPPNKVDFVDIALSNNDPQSDTSRQEAFQKNLDRKIILLKSPIKIHASNIRESMRDNTEKWVNFLPSSIIKIIQENNALKRI